MENDNDILEIIKMNLEGKIKYSKKTESIKRYCESMDNLISQLSYQKIAELQIKITEFLLKEAKSDEAILC